MFAARRQSPWPCGSLEGPEAAMKEHRGRRGQGARTVAADGEDNVEGRAAQVMAVGCCGEDDVEVRAGCGWAVGCCGGRTMSLDSTLLVRCRSKGPMNRRHGSMKMQFWYTKTIDMVN